MALFLVRHDEDSVIDDDLALALDRFELRPGLLLVESELSLSQLYHRIKWSLPAGSPLLVAPLGGPPKFKGMAEGALKVASGARARGGQRGEAGRFAKSTTWISMIFGERAEPPGRFDTRP
jgi:hypothetical protein